MDDAACVETHPDIFFPEKGQVAYVRAAREICGGCPVRELCLGYALVNDVRFGVWGGLTPVERWRLRRSRV